jgi:hypothetical protein
VKRRRTLALLALGALLCARGAYAQATVPPSKPIDYGKTLERIQQLPADDARVGDDGARLARTEYDMWALQYRRESFEWQYTSTIIIFWAVIVLIVAGLGLSYMQFNRAKKTASPTSIKIGRDGLEISSEVIGLLILFFSLGFFYLYLTNVYPIIEVGAAAAPPAAVAK